MLIAAVLMIASLGTTAQSSEPLNQESLKKMIGDLGYDSTENKSTTGAPMHLLTFTRGDLKFTMYISLSGNLSRVWLTCPLADLPDNDKLNAETLVKLLQLSDELGPVHFGLKTRRLYISFPLENTDVTSKKLRQTIDDLTAYVITTRPHWSNIQK